MPEVRCIHPDCAARMPRRVNFCPLCGAPQSVEVQREAALARPRAAAPAVKPAAPAAVAPAPPSARAPGRRTGIGFWIVALAIMFSFWLSYSDDKKPAQPGKLRHNASQDQRK